MTVVDVIIAVVWVAFWLYWLAASVRVKTGRTRWGQFAGVRVALILLALLLVRLRVFRSSEATHSPWLGGIGLAVFLLGIALAVWARAYLGHNWGMPMTEKAEPELVTTGPYRTIRHPIYAGIILAMAGTTIAVGLYWLIGVALLVAYFSYSAVMEERYMTQRLPDAYPEYKRSTKMLIPYIL